MNPGGNNMIATYENDAEGRGGIVFDSGFHRLLNDSFGKYDNSKYITNIAEWLEGHNNSLNDNNILIYNTVRESGLDNSKLNRNAPMVINQRGEFTVSLTDRKETPEITETLLENYSQLWIFFGESGKDCCFSDTELEVISGFADDGSSMLIVAGNDKNGMKRDWTGANSMSSRFGVSFSGYIENGDEIQISTSAYFFNRISEILGKVYRFMT